MEKEKRAKGINFKKLNPSGYREVPKGGGNRPLIYMKYPMHGMQGADAGSALLLDYGEITVVYDVCKCNKSNKIEIPVYIWKKHFNSFVEEEVIDMGIITQPDIIAEYHLNLANRNKKPAVIKRVRITKEGYGIEIKVATFLNYMVPLPAGQRSFKAFVIVAQVKNKDVEIGYVRGKIEFDVDVGGEPFKFKVPFRVGYFKNMFGPESNFHFTFNKFLNGGNVRNKLNGKFQSKKIGKLIIKKMRLLGENDYLKFIDKLVKKELRPQSSVNSFVLDVVQPEEFYENEFTHDFELLTVDTLETSACLVTKFYVMRLMCSVQSAEMKFHKCKSKEVLDLEYIAVHHSKVVPVHILNPTEDDITISKLYSSMDSDLYEITIETQENKDRKSDPSEFLRIRERKEMELVIKPSEVITIRFRIMPSKFGKVEESFTFDSNSTVSPSH